MKTNITYLIIGLVVGIVGTVIIGGSYASNKATGVFEYLHDSQDDFRAINGTLAATALKKDNLNDYRDFINYSIDQGLIDNESNYAKTLEIFLKENIDNEKRKYNDLTISIYANMEKIRSPEKTR